MRSIKITIFGQTLLLILSCASLAAQITGVVPTSVNTQAGGTYVLLSSDNNKLINLTGASPAVTIPTAGGAFPNGWHAQITFNGTGTATLTTASGTIDGAATATITAAAGAGFFLTNNGTNWFTTRGSGGGSSPLFTATADKTVVSSTAETSIIGTGVGSKTTPANYFVAGTSILLNMNGYFQSAVVDTLNVKIKAGSVIAGATGAVAYGSLVSNQAFRLYALVTCRTAGASGTFQVNTIFETTGSALAPQESKIINTADVVIDTTGTIAWDITATWSASSASDTITGKTFSMQVPGGSPTGLSLPGVTSDGANGIAVVGNVSVGTTVLSPTLGITTPNLANLTTTGAVPFVTAPGILNQDQTAGGQLFWDSVNHRLGVGTNTPGVRLQVVGSTDILPALGTAGGATGILGVTGLYGLYIGQSSGTGASWLQSMRNDSATAFNLLLNPQGGNVGIGTTGPTANLQVKPASDSISVFSVLNNAGSSVLNVDTTNGRLGLGTNAPSAQLDMLNGSNRIKFNPGSGSAPQITLTNGTHTTYFGINGNLYNTIGTQDNAPFVFLSNNAERAAISANGGFALGSSYFSTNPGSGNMIVQGNVGIGTTSPLARLHSIAALIYNDVPTTGATSFQIRAGAADGVGTKLLQGFLNDGTTETWSISRNGSFTTIGSAIIGAGVYLGTSGNSVLLSRLANGVLQLTNDAGSDFGRLQFGGTTASFPSLKRSTTSLQVRLADDSADADLKFQSRISGGAAPGISGCAATIGTGSANSSGFFTSGTTGACTVVLTFATTAPTGWVCSANNLTTANLDRQTAYTPTTATLQGTTATADILNYSCSAF